MIERQATMHRSIPLFGFVLAMAQCLQTPPTLLCTALLSAILPLKAEVDLRPGAVLRLEFPELPPTLYAQAKNDPVPATLTAQLPDNYAPEGRWPLFVFIAGGVGAKATDVSNARKIVGTANYVVVGLPLFQRAFDPTEEAKGMALGVDDFDTLRNAYRIMLGKLMQSVPGIVAEGSAMGGFSNGAHATALLIAGHDEFTLEHFRQFFFVDGGAPFLAAFGLMSPSLNRCRFLQLRGDQDLPGTGKKNPEWGSIRDRLNLICDAVHGTARSRGLNWTQVIMRGRGHSFDPEFQVVVGQWIRGEKMDDVPPKTPVNP